MLEHGVDPQKSLPAQTQERLAFSFQIVIAEHTSEHKSDNKIDGITKIVGFREVDWDTEWGRFTSRQPISVINLLTEQFDRCFCPSLRETLQSLIHHPFVKKPALFEALFHKYLGIEPTNQQWSMLSQPNAYVSLPQEDSPDFDLHLYFLQPFRLFGISQNNRKYISKSWEMQNREWLWDANPNADAAPFLRHIIQIFIISEILQAMAEREVYEDNEQEKEYQRRLQQVSDELVTSISKELKTLINQTSLPEEKSNKLAGSPEGLFGTWLRQHPNSPVHVLRSFLSVYPLGRLLFRQPEEEVHRIFADHMAPAKINGHLTRLNYLFWWLVAHLNLPTIRLSLRLSKMLLIKNVRDFYWLVTHPNQTFFDNLFEKSIYFAWSVFGWLIQPVVVFSALLFGLTSIPFTLLREFFIYGPVERFKHYNWLKLLDSIEFVKDCLLFMLIAMPLFGVFLGVLASLFPPVTQVGLMICFLITGALSGLLFGGEMDLSLFTRIAQYENLLFFIAFIVTSVISYFVGISLAQAAAQFVPPSVYDKMSRLGALLQNGLNLINKWVTDFWSNIVSLFAGNKTILELRAINPHPRVAIELPVLTRHKIATSLVKRAEELRNQLTLIAPYNHNAAQLAQRKAVLNDLIIMPETTEAMLKLSVARAEAVARSVFNHEEIQRLKEVLDQLPAEAQLVKERMAMRAAEVNGGYQPSWELVRLIQQEHRQLPLDLHDKCERIARLAASPIIA